MRHRLLLCLLLTNSPLLAAEPRPVEFQATQEGANITLSINGPTSQLVEGDNARVAIQFRDAVSGAPLRGLRPAVWLESRRSNVTTAGEDASCRERVSHYLRGSVSSRPLVDLNGYFLMVLNRDPTISVIDPIVGISGRTNLYTSIILPRSGADWAEQVLRRRMLVSMPRANQVAVIDTESFKVRGLLNTGKEPLRVKVQQRGPLAFSANDGDGTVSVLDLAEIRPVTTLGVGAGHHELALVERSARLFVTNQGDRTVSVVDTAALRTLRNVSLDGIPTSLADVPVAAAVAVAHGLDGRITLLADDTGTVRRSVVLGTEINVIESAPDGRSLLALATQARKLYVLDPADLAVRHEVALVGRPYQLQFTRELLHVRHYDTERVTTLPISALSGKTALVAGGYAAGTGGPRPDSVVVMASGLSSTPDGLAAIIVNPADGQIHYYMEGMNAPAGAFRNYGHPPQAVHATDRALKETQPGNYEAELRLPVAGRLSVALRLDQPRVVECFEFEVGRNSLLEQADQRYSVAMTGAPTFVPPLARRRLEFHITDEQGSNADLPEGAELLYYRAPGTDRRSVPLRALGQGRYEAQVQLDESGAWYLQLSAKVKLTPPHFSVIVRPEQDTPNAPVNRK